MRIMLIILAFPIIGSAQEFGYKADLYDNWKYCDGKYVDVVTRGDSDRMIGLVHGNYYDYDFIQQLRSRLMPRYCKSLMDIINERLEKLEGDSQ